MPEKILRLLKRKDGFVSGQEISAGFGITRAAVWKKIKLLKKKGFVIDAAPSKGYKLVKSPEFSTDEIRADVASDFWKTFYFYDSVDSTNEVAASLSLKNEVESGTVVIADSQKRGRGRLGRTWISPPGVNIYMSVILRPEIPPKDATLLTVLAAVASATALRDMTEIDFSIKWPNDLIVSGKKVGGILTEVRSEPDSIKIAIIGIGINVNIARKDFPDEIKSIATSVRGETGKYHSRSEIISRILNEFEGWYMTLVNIGREPLLEKWRQLSSTLGKEIEVTTSRETISGFAEDIDEEGMLIVKLRSGALKRISAGDIEVLS